MPLDAPAEKGLGMASLSSGAEKALKNMFGSGTQIRPQHAELYQLDSQLRPDQKKIHERLFESQGVAL